MNDGEDPFEEYWKLFEELLRALGGRRFEINETPDDLSTDHDEIVDNDILDFRPPTSLEELEILIKQDLTPSQQYRRDEAREKRVMATIFVFGAAGFVATALTGNVAILVPVLMFIYRLLGTLS